MIVECIAKVSCDVCGTEFPVNVDPAYVPPAGWSIFEVIEDSIRGDCGCMVVDDQHLCGECGRKSCKELT